MMNEDEPDDTLPAEEQQYSDYLENGADESSDSDDSWERESIVSPLTVGSARPVKGEAFCDCYKTGKEKDCVCGEDDTCMMFCLV